MTGKTKWMGHSENDNGNGVMELLKDHLEAVANRAARYTGVWGHSNVGKFAGFVHDIGKYADQMQERLKNPYQTSGRNHSAAGACCLAIKCENSLPLALAVLYHHGGLKEYFGSRKRLVENVGRDLKENSSCYTDPDFSLMLKRFLEDFPVFNFAPFPKLTTGKMATDMFDVRMISSALVDADFVETEAHFAGNAKVLRLYRPKGPNLDADRALQSLLNEIEGKTTKNKTVANVRRQLFENCFKAATQVPGLFTLTAPTGAGKTLSILAFALKHASDNGLRRIVLVMPFLNIIDQTARQYRKIYSEENGFSSTYVLEDHSLSGFRGGSDDMESEQSRTQSLLSENWDAPIILTTSVNLFESLHSSRNSKLRKLHQLAKSVIVFDEAQSLPPELAALSLATLSRLTDTKGPYGSSVVFTTATQPAFESLAPLINKYSSSGWHPASLISEQKTIQLFKEMSGRVSVVWRDQQPITLVELSEEIVKNKQKQILCIVNLKRHAQELAELVNEMDDGSIVFHLSTYMCPLHRKVVLEKIEDRLNTGLPVILIATQCIEAGVDISFPFVYRALAPLESIAQAAGRCNRHGEGVGKVIVFKPHDEKGYFPPGYRKGVRIIEDRLANLRSLGKKPDDTNILNSPDFIRSYYTLFFQLGRLDRINDSQKDLFQAVDAGDFAVVDNEYEMISGDMVNVLVPYSKEKFDKLREEVQVGQYMTGEEIRKWVASARELAVGLFRPQDDSFSWQALEPVQFGATSQYDNHNADWFVLLSGAGAQYDEFCGLKLPDEFVGLC